GRESREIHHPLLLRADVRGAPGGMALRALQARGSRAGQLLLLLRHDGGAVVTCSPACVCRIGRRSVGQKASGDRALSASAIWHARNPPVTWLGRRSSQVSSWTGAAAAGLGYWPGPVSYGEAS